jgi:hypothetical protein
MKDSLEFKLGSMTMVEYERQLLELLKYVDFIKDEEVNIYRFFHGLPSIFSDKIQYDDPKTLEENIRRDKCLYDHHRGRQTFQKVWEDKKKGKMEQRKKGTKTPLFKNNYHGQPTCNEPRMIETMGKIPRKQPTKCWGCEGEHKYRYFPHRGEKMKIFHNIRHVDTIEDMGINVLRIYEALDKNQVEFQFDMIEVEGKINNQLIVSLIDS